MAKRKRARKTRVKSHHRKKARKRGSRGLLGGKLVKGIL
jgi:hypothetical protein